jgi:hypothetical protein
MNLDKTIELNAFIAHYLKVQYKDNTKPQKLELNPQNTWIYSKFIPTHRRFLSLVLLDKLILHTTIIPNEDN